MTKQQEPLLTDEELFEIICQKMNDNRRAVHQLDMEYVAYYQQWYQLATNMGMFIPSFLTPEGDDVSVSEAKS